MLRSEMISAHECQPLGAVVHYLCWYTVQCVFAYQPVPRLVCGRRPALDQSDDRLAPLFVQLGHLVAGALGRLAEQLGGGDGWVVDVSVPCTQARSSI